MSAANVQVVRRTGDKLAGIFQLRDGRVASRQRYENPASALAGAGVSSE